MNQTKLSSWKRSIALFMIGQAVSLFGSALVDFAIIWHITLATKSGVIMTIGILCTFLPRLFISFFAGVWADRYHRKRLIMFADGGIAFVTLLLAIAFLSGFQELWLIFIVLGVRSLGTGIQTPAVSALIPQIVPQNNLMRINGINGSLQSFIMLLAPAASGALLSLLPLGAIFFIDVITALISIIILFLIPVKHHYEEQKENPLSYYQDLKQGLHYARKNIFVREMLILYAFYFFLISPAAFLSPLFVARVFGEDVWLLTANEIAFSLGTMLGGILIAKWNGVRNRINIIATSCIIIGITNLVLGFVGFYVFLLMMLIMGVFISFFSSIEMTLFQEKVEQNMQGRVFGLVQVVATTVMPIGMLLFGPLGDVVDVKIIFLVCGILISILGIYVFFNKRLKRAVGESAQTH